MVRIHPLETIVHILQRFLRILFKSLYLRIVSLGLFQILGDVLDDFLVVNQESGGLDFQRLVILSVPFGSVE